ncbi:MAG: ATP-binding protein [Oscillospiraceae bacterium]|nr:ATP-binding protein [Oscillospiraceae bacterium]
MENRKRLHFGVIFSTMDTTNQYDIWSGIVEYARMNDIHLTAYFGTYQMTTNDFASHFDTCFETIRNNGSLDGIIMFSGFMAHILKNENFEKYAARIPGRLPVVSVSYIMPGAVSVIVDNLAGMHDAVEHLIRVHGKKKIAFVKGPDGHPEAQKRLEGYKMALEANGIAYDDRYIFPGNFDQDSGKNAVKKLLEMTDISADAIAACNDMTAMGILNELKNNNLSAPADFAVTGFDDDKESAAFIPSISTARQDFRKFGLVSAEMLLDQIKGKPVEKIINMTPVFMERQSCGCANMESANEFAQGVRQKEMEFREIALKDNRWIVRRVASNLVLIFDIDSLAEELHKTLPSISIDSAIIGLYRRPIKSGDPNADRTINTLIGFDGDTKFNIKNNRGAPIVFSDYSTIEKFDFEKKRRDVFFVPLFFKDEEFGTMLMPFDPDIAVDTYEALRINISAAVKGAELIKEINSQNELLKSALAQANEASRAKSDFLSSMSHEMRTPMNAIIGMTAIGKKAKNAAEKDYALNKIEAASSHLLGVINDILDMSKIEANKLELAPVEFDFEKMLQKVVAVASFRVEEKKQSLRMNVDKKIPRLIVADEQRLAQVLTNLISNAVKFTPEFGNIDFEASLIGETDEFCELRVFVADSGIGISPEQQGRLFRAFEQAESGTNRQYGGTGLGLVISKNIVELMGGRIWIESELGKGAKFIFTIKASRSEKNPLSPIFLEGGLDGCAGRTQVQIEESGYAEGEFEGKRLLLAEDVAINREILVDLLADTGIEIDCAENGREALEMIESSGRKYDIVFMDVQMPKMDGYEATRAIRALPHMKNIKLPIIAMTANAFKSDVDESYAAGMDEHLRKPIDFEKVLKVLRKYL